MGRGRFGIVAVAICLALTVSEPGILDQIRYPLALVLSWPARALSEWVGEEPRTVAELGLETARFQETWEAANSKQANADGFRIFATIPEKLTFFIEGGWDRGLRRGSVVHDGVQLLGFIDLVTQSASRVRLVSHASSHVAGRIDVSKNKDLPRASSLDLLLSGRGHSGLVARQGCRIHREFNGQVVRYLDDKGLWNLEIGVIGLDKSIDQLAVKPRIDLDAIDYVLIGDFSDEIEAPEGPENLSAKVLAVGRTSAAGVTWLLSRGSQDGAQVGAWVAYGGALIGRLDRVGAFSSFMRPLSAAIDLVDCKIIDRDGEFLGHAIWRPASDKKTLVGHYFSRGRGPRNGLPAGLWLGEINSQNKRSSPIMPARSESVTIYSALPSRTTRRLGLGR